MVRVKIQSEHLPGGQHLALISSIDASSTIFPISFLLSKSGFAPDAPGTHGYAPKGQRCWSTRDWHAKGRVNAIGAILDFEFVSVEFWEYTVHSDVFHAWATQALLPKCPPESVIVLDNASFHKCEAIQTSIKEAGHILE